MTMEENVSHNRQAMRSVAGASLLGFDFQAQIYHIYIYIYIYIIIIFYEKNSYGSLYASNFLNI